MLRNLVDLLNRVRSFVTLPGHSYSLKVVEQYLGFDEFGGKHSRRHHRTAGNA